MNFEAFSFIVLISFQIFWLKLYINIMTHHFNIVPVSLNNTSGLDNQTHKIFEIYAYIASRSTQEYNIWEEFSIC